MLLTGISGSPPKHSAETATIFLMNITQQVRRSFKENKVGKHLLLFQSQYQGYHVSSRTL
jgi:hypothetical protein